MQYGRRVQTVSDWGRPVRTFLVFGALGMTVACTHVLVDKQSRRSGHGFAPPATGTGSDVEAGSDTGAGSGDGPASGSKADSAWPPGDTATARLCAAGVPVARDDALSAAATVNTRLALRLLARRDATVDTLEAPLALSFALGTALAGARGGTATELAQAFGSEQAPNALGDAAQLSARDVLCPDADGGARTGMTVAAFVARSLEMGDDFATAVPSRFGASVIPAAFSDSAAAAAINARITAAQPGTPAVVPDAAAGADTRLLLTAVTAFHGKWRTPFNPAATAGAPFFVNGGAARAVPTMKAQKLAALLADRPAYTVVALPYSGASDLLIFVPKAKDGLAAVLAALTTAELEAARNDLRAVTLDINLPKFALTTAGSAAADAKALGIAAAFDPKVADFRGILTAPAGGAALALGDVIQYAAFAVDEAGSAAADATMATASDADAAVPEHTPPAATLVVDRPFAFFVEHKAVHIVLSGVVVAP